MVDAENDETIEEPPEEPEEAPPEGPEWNWWLLVIPAVAIVVFVVVLLYGANILDPQAIHEEVGILEIVVAGAILLVALLVAEIILIFSGHPEHLEDEEEPAPGPQTPAARQDIPAEEPSAAEIEMLATDDEVEGRTVLEVARPPKGTVDAGVYATTYVDVDTDSVLRLEEIVALRSRQATSGRSP